LSRPRLYNSDVLSWFRAQDFVWLALFSGLALASPRRSAAEMEMLAALAVLQVAAPKLRGLNTDRGNIILLCLKLIIGFLLIGVTGGILSSYYLVLLIPVLSAATTLGGWGAALFTALACVAYLVFLPLAYFIEYPITADLLREVGLRVIFLPVVGYLTFQLAESNRVEARRAQAVAGQLAEANRSLQAAEAAVRRTERLAALGQLTAGLAHELRNPMGTMKASAEMLQKRVEPENSIAIELAGYISSEVDRANSLITRFLEFARPLQLRRAAVDVNELVDRVAEGLGASAANAGVTIHRNFAPDVPRLELDAQLMERAVSNLLLNAIQASSEGGIVTVKTRLKLNGWVEIAIIDRGVGIPAGLTEQIFNPFFTTKSDGVGLGLAIVSKVIDEHGGKIRVESEPGSGSIFLVDLPETTPSQT